MNYDEIIQWMRKNGTKRNRDGMARFGINVDTAFGVSVTEMRKLAKNIDKSHALAKQLWDSGYHEARIMASIVEEHEKVTEAQFARWARDFNSWDVCDMACMNTFWKAQFAHKKCIEYSKKKSEFEKRTAFALMAVLAFKDKEAKDRDFERFLPIIKRESTDERNFVRKAVNWALRGIGKRNKALNKKAIKTAKEIEKIDSKAARWIAKDAIRELEGEAVQKRLSG